MYEADAPNSYAGVNQFAQAIGRQPNLVSYYNHWLEPFQVRFATSAAKHGAVTSYRSTRRMSHWQASLAGQYDAYLRSYAHGSQSIRRSGGLVVRPRDERQLVLLGIPAYFPGVFVAAWRHVVTVFRAEGAENVTWLWTVNVIDISIPIPDPAPWWPGSSYVNWVGIDGYYYLPSQSFSQVFGPTIVAVRNLTGDPILIAETGAEPDSGQPAKINDLFTGIRSYGLLGFVWFDEDTQGRVWKINSPASFAALRQDATAFMRPAATPGPTPRHLSSGSSSS